MTRRSFGALARDRRGAAAVEFALVVPVFLMLLLGGMEFGRYVWTAVTLEHAAREATRFALVHPEGGSSMTADEIATLARSRAAGLAADALDVAVSWSGGTGSGGTVTVAVSYTYSFLLSGFLPLEPVVLSGASSMTIS